jgi:ABC-type enterochelin transport system substrate-binding protein
MNRLLCATLVALALAGCQSAPKTENAAETTTPAATEAASADAPVLIAEFVDQTTVWECPKCGMVFDRAGVCSMEGAALVEMKVNYVCPADNKPVEKAGKCPRCPQNARIDKVAVAATSEGGH